MNYMKSDSENNNGALVIIIIIAVIWIWSNYSRISELETANIYLESTISEYQSALGEANDNIEQANSNIEDAQGQAWENYQTMGEALESLETVDIVDEP